jgi:hypothetical protein
LTLRLHFAHRPAVPFLASPTLERFSRILPGPRVLPGVRTPFVPPFGVFRWAVSISRPNPPESRPPCWCAVAADYPLGNCDWPGIETLPSYLIRFGTVSNRSSPPSPSFAFDDARTSPEELVNFASVLRTSRSGFKRGGINQPDPTFPRLPGIILELSRVKQCCRRPAQLGCLLETVRSIFAYRTSTFCG